MRRIYELLIANLPRFAFCGALVFIGLTEIMWAADGMPTRTRAVCVGDKVRIRASADIRSKILTEVPLGSVLEVNGKSDTTSLINGIHQPWYLVALNEYKGWMSGAYLSFDFAIGPENAWVTWVEMISAEGASDAYYLCVYDYVTKKIQKKQIVISYAVFSPSGRYVAVDEGSAPLGDLKIFTLPEMKELHSFTHDRKPVIWKGDSFRFKLCEEHFSPEGMYYDWEEMIFDTGKVVKTGVRGRN